MLSKEIKITKGTPEYHPNSLLCQKCHEFFYADAADMVKWNKGFSPVRCADCKEKEKENARNL